MLNLGALTGWEFFMEKFVRYSDMVSAGKIRLGRNVRISETAVIEEGCIIGDNVFIGHYCVLRPGTCVGSDTTIGHLTVFEGNCSIGERCLIHAQCHITKGAVIEDDVFIAPMFVGANDPIMCHNRRDRIQYVEQGYHIKRAARLGIGVKVLPGVVIGENAVIGAGSVVTKDIPDRSVALGVPAKIVSKVALQEVI